ncbi:MAG: ABC transporter permease [Bacteroidales bacterium]
MFNNLTKFGDYIFLLYKTFSRPDRWSEFFRRYIDEIYKLGIDSVAIVITISLFIGAVISIQTQMNITSPFIPSYTVGLLTRETILLEFSSTIMALILAGKVGSSISSEIGTMRVTEQIDALDIMGVNSANYLILPKITALVTFIPILVIISMFTGLTGGYLVGVFMDIFPVSRYTYGLQTYFQEFYVWYSIIKSLFFGFVISSVASYYGYSVKGGAAEVGKASTDAVVVSSVSILLLDVLLTKLLLQ